MTQDRRIELSVLQLESMSKQCEKKVARLKHPRFRSARGYWQGMSRAFAQAADLVKRQLGDK